MSLTKEWLNRIVMWKEKLKDFFYLPLEEVTFEGFVTRELLDYDRAVRREFRSMPEGTKWGGKWEYGWFRTRIKLPEQARGHRIVLKADTGGESAVYINGQNAGAFDRTHKEVTLSRCASPGEEYEIVIESYAGHGLRLCVAGPVEPGKIIIPEPPETQAVVGKSTFGIWNETAYMLWLDVHTLHLVRDNLDPDSLRVAEIDQALRNFTTTVDFETSTEKMIETMEKCRRDLRPLMECVNGSTTPELFAFGHSHIDVVWLWPLAETERKCSRTFATQIGLMEEYPEFKFLQSQPHLYMMVKEKYPRLYEKIHEYIKKGQFIPDGGMWVEPDTNVTGGESLIRQFIHGKKFFMDEFGVDSRLCWLPDVFGYSGAFPQIMKGCEVDYFSTQKILWHYKGGTSFPYNTFWWEGIDGTRVLAHIHFDYNSHTSPDILIKRWKDREQKDGISTRLFPFGYGDGGGGPTRDHIEYLIRCKDLEGVPKTRICEPMDFFRDLEERGIPDAVYVGELYLQVHRGTYTSQAKTKKGNRKSENLLREAEMWGVAAKALKGFDFNAMTLDKAWKLLLLNQFHDILPGSSIERVYREAEAQYEEIQAEAMDSVRKAVKSIVGENNALTVFNSLSWDSDKIVEIPGSFENVTDARGNKLTVQAAGDKKYAEVTVPSCGWTTIYPVGTKAEAADNGAAQFDVVDRAGRFNAANGAAQLDGVAADDRTLENNLIRIKFNDSGEITSIYDKENRRELAAECCNSFRMYKDVPGRYDAWDIDSMYEQTAVDITGKAEMEVVCQGPLFASIKIKKTLNNSKMEQEVVMYRNSRRVDFRTRIDWQESHKLLKVNFPVNVHANEAIHEIQFGYLKRPNHYSTEADRTRYEVCNHKWTALAEENHGFAVLNDCKYGVNVYGNSINLTLLKSAMAPDMNADRGMQEFTYAFYIWEGPFAESRLVREGYELNCPPVTMPGDGGSRSLFAVDKENIIIDTVKPAEDGSGKIIVRMYESMRMSTTCRLTTSLPVTEAAQTNMLERNPQTLEMDGNDILLNFRPFEIKTVALSYPR